VVQGASVKNRSARLLYRALLAAGLSSTLLSAQTTAIDPSHEASLNRWLEVSGLSKDWELEKLRWGPDPSPIAAENHQALRLELRFRNESTNQEEEDKRFQQHLATYQADYGEAAPQRIFNKLIHECHVSVRDSAITLRVLQRDYVVFFDPAGGLLMQPKGDRSYAKEVPLELPAIATGTQMRGLGTANNPDRRALSALIGNFVRDYFTGVNRKANMPEPTFDPDDVDNRDHDHIGFVITGIRGQILTGQKYWEQLEISLDVVQAPSGLKLLCHIDGYYAGGMGNNRPSPEAYQDMRKQFQGPLKAFSDRVLLELQKRIAAGR
jgi:hypothetical protein